MLFTPLEIASFAGAAVALALAPGPDLIFVLSLSMAQGRRAGAIRRCAAPGRSGTRR